MDKKYFVLYLLPLRSDFAQTMTEEERGIMTAHVGYWTGLMKKGKVITFGPVLDPKEVYGLGIVSVDNEQEVQELITNDPAGKINKYENFPIKPIDANITKPMSGSR
jgi:uncharacterized protein YciI